MKILVLADIDDYHWHGGKGTADLLLSCGDVADHVIGEAAQAFGVPPIFAVKGNHDDDAPFPSPIVDLHLQTVILGGLRFGGFNGAWRYKPHGHFLYDQWEVDDMLTILPPVDVLLTHNSPLGIHDQDDGIHEGFEALLTYIERAKPRDLMHGHQHVNQETQVGETRVIGVYGWRVLEI